MAAVEPGTATPAPAPPPVVTKSTATAAPAAPATATSAPTPKPATAPPTAATDDQIIAYASATYGYLAAFLTDPQIGPLLLQAAREGWDRYRLEGALTKTAWWKTTTQVAREWDALTRLDPATAKAKLAATALTVRTQAQRLGLTLDGATLNGISLNVNRLGWTDQQVQAALAAHIQLGTKPGSASATMDSLRSMASDYAVNLSPQALLGWTRNVVAGTQTQEGFRSYLLGQAKSLFPSIADALDGGETVKQWFDPYVQAASSILGINPSDVDLAQDKWRRALVQNDPAKPGARIPMSLDQWQTELKTNALYGYDRTVNGRAAAGAFADQLNHALGQGG